MESAALELVRADAAPIHALADVPWSAVLGVWPVFTLASHHSIDSTRADQIPASCLKTVRHFKFTLDLLDQEWEKHVRLGKSTAAWQAALLSHLTDVQHGVSTMESEVLGCEDSS